MCVWVQHIQNFVCVYIVLLCFVFVCVCFSHKVTCLLHTVLYNVGLTDFSWCHQVPEFEEAAFNTALNKVVRCKTKFGWHLLQVLSERCVIVTLLS